MPGQIPKHVPISRKGRFLVLYDEFAEGLKDFVVFSIGAKEVDGCLVEEDSIASVCGGSASIYRLQNTN